VYRNSRIASMETGMRRTNGPPAAISWGGCW
jgi:hypothetical protein